MKKVSLFLIFALLTSLLSGCASMALPGLPAFTAAPAAPALTTPAPTAPAPTTPAPAAPAPTTPTPAETHATGPEETSRPELPSGEVHPMLFHVTGPEGQEGYLFGTIHVGDARIDTVLELLKPYLDRCDALAVEFDLLAYEKDLGAQMKSMTQFVLTDGSKASDHMPEELFQRASALLSEAGLMPNLMQSYNLAMWSQLVEQAAVMTRSSYNSETGMDRSLIQYCYEKQIPVRDVESAEFQYSLLAGFSDELNLLLIESVLDNLDTYGESIDELYNAWLSGDYARIVEVLNEETEEDEELTEEQIALLEDYNDKLLTQRNLGMRDKALEWLKAGDKVFFAVGAAHLVDEGGLVELLRAEGCTVEQILGDSAHGE